MATVHETLNLVHDEKALQRFGITVCETSSIIDEDLAEGWLVEQREAVDSFWRLLIELASARSWSQMQFVSLQPQALAAVLCTDAATAQRELDKLRVVWGAVAQAEKAVVGKSLQPGQKAALAEVLQDMGWHRLQVAREVKMECQAAGWQASDEQVQLAARLVCGGPSQTKFQLEDLFSHLISVARAANLPRAMNKWLCSYML